MSLSIVIQAGGQSRRMGSNKALLRFRGQPLVAWVVSRLRPLAGELLVTTNQPEALAFLNLPLVPDLLPGKGALGGLYTALNAARFEQVAVVACDMPFVAPALISAEANLLTSGAWDAVVPSSSEGVLEPLSAVYRRRACLPAVKAALDSGEMRMVSWFPQVKLHILDAAETARFAPGPYSFFNINTPEDLELSEQLAGYRAAGFENS